MRVLHTSDWHIGKKLYNKDLDAVHLQFFNWLIDLINREKIDVLLVSGDIFDIAYPSNSALELYYRFLTQLIGSQCKSVIITGGNHDSVSTLNAPRNILKHLNIQIFGGAESQREKQIVEIHTNEKIELVVAAVPFLRDKDVRKSVAGQTSPEIAQAIRSGITSYYRQMADLVQPYRQRKIPTIAMGHLYVAGASISDSERDIHIGNLGKVPHDMLPPEFDYYALGHIHRPQIIAKQQNIRYSGSPIPLSFSEKNDPKQVVLIDFQNGEMKIEPILCPTWVKLVNIKANFAEFEIQIVHWKTQNSGTPVFFEVEITEDVYKPELISELTRVVDECGLDILNYKIKFTQQPESLADFYTEKQNLKDLSAKDVFRTKLDDTEVADKEQLMNTFNELLEMYNSEKNG